MKKLFQYCVLFHKYEETEKGKKYVDTEIVIPPKTMLAKNEKEAVFKITREVPEQFATDPDHVEILIKGF